MRDLSATQCRGIAQQVRASAPLQARLDGCLIIPGLFVPANGPAWNFGPATGAVLAL